MFYNIDQTMALFIPRVFPQWINETTLADIFHKQNIGLVYKVSISKKRKEKKDKHPIFNAFVYFTAWYDTQVSYNLQQRLTGPQKQARIIYDDPWYWTVFEHKFTNHQLKKNELREIRIGLHNYRCQMLLLSKIDTLSTEISYLSDAYADFYDEKEMALENAEATATSVAEFVLKEDLQEELELENAKATATSVAEFVLKEEDLDEELLTWIRTKLWVN
jgi:hypothetical protein